MQSHRQQFLSSKYFWAVLALFCLTVVLVNPIRETAMDDDWSYALTLKHLLNTGHYKLDDWAWANPAFQIYWAALFAKIFGYSFSIMRVSTLILCAAGLVFFYLLCREQGFSPPYSALLLFMLFSSPLFLRFSFTFMTDVPFLSCAIAAFYFYSRGLRQNKWKWLLAGSISAAAATLTRQIGLAFVPALLLLMFFHPERRKINLLLAALALPALAALWQMQYTYDHPNWCIRVRGHEQALYLALGLRLVPMMVWRTVTALQYLSLFCLPFVFLCAWKFLSSVAEKSTAFRRRKIVAASVVLIIVATTIYSVVVRQNWLMPTLSWNLEPLRNSRYSLACTVVTLIGATFFGCIFAWRYMDAPGFGRLTDSQKLVDLVTLFLLLQHLLFFAYGDEYLIAFLPFTILSLGYFFREQWQVFADLLVAGCALILIFSMLWTRAALAREEAWWQAGEVALQNGADPTQVWGSGPWKGYYTFHNYVEEVKDRDIRNLNDFFYRWNPEQKKHKKYFMFETPYPPIGRWKVLGEFTFRDINLRTVRLFSVQVTGSYNEQN